MLSVVTGRQMCEFIVDVWREHYGVEVEPHDIWNASPTGELFHVFVLYEHAKATKASR